MTYCCNGLCERYAIKRVVSKDQKSLYDCGCVRCSACSTIFSVIHTKVDRAGIKCCLCCGCRVRAKPRGKFKKVMPTITMVKKIKKLRSDF